MALLDTNNRSTSTNTDKPRQRTVGILIFEEAEVLDFAGPFEVFSVASELYDYQYFDVKIIAKTQDPVRAMNGLSVNPHHSFEDAPDLDILIVPGGRGARQALKDKVTLKWMKKAVHQSELTMSVCTGSAILAKMGLLNGKPYCTHHSVYSLLESLAPTATPQKNKRFVQADEKLYTSAGISAGIDLSLHIVEKLHGKEVAYETAKYMEYKGHP